MIHGCVTLDEVFLAASVRAASLVPETSGYLALAVGDATSKLPFAIDDRVVMLTTEGNVGITKRGEVLPPKQAAAGLRNVLTRLLAVSQGTAMPALATAGKPREESDRGVDAVVEEIEAALIPVNRAAARRALARLARETIKAKEAGKVKARSIRPPADKAAPAEIDKPKPTVVASEKPAKEAERPAFEPVVEAAKVPVAEPARVPVVAVRVATPKAPSVVVKGVIKSVDVVVEATTPPPLDIEPRTALTAPIVILPTPPPVPVFRPATPAPPMVDYTPTLLGMGAIEVEGVSPAPHEEITIARTITIEAPVANAQKVVDEEENVETVQAPSVAPIEETRSVLAQPSEDRGVAFELDFKGPRPSLAEPITPPFALDAEPPPRDVPVTRVDHAGNEDALPAFDLRAGKARIEPAKSEGTRADDLLARFGASCSGDAQIVQTAACLRQMADVDTPAPSRAARVSRKTQAVLDLSPEPQTMLRAAVPVSSYDLETPTIPRARGVSFGVALAVLAIGVMGGGALVRLRPDLFGAAPVRVETTTVTPPAKPAATHATTAEPQGATWTPSGGARAERGSVERAR